eukprot:jgi/Tetstr1/446760/TSEL_034247.t1
MGGAVAPERPPAEGHAPPLSELRKRLQLHHPDKGGDLNTFLQLYRTYAARRHAAEQVADGADGAVGAADGAGGHEEGPGSGRAPCEREEVAQGDARHAEGRHREALLVYSKLLRRFPNEAQLYLKCASALLASGSPAAAQKFAQKAADIRPMWHEAHVCLGHCLQGQDLAGEAATAFQRALDINPALELGAETISAQQSPAEHAAPPLDPGEPPSSEAPHSGPVRAAKFCPDDQQAGLLATASLDAVVSLWRVSRDCGAPPTHVASFTEHQGGVTELEWSPSGAKLASCSLDMTCHVRTLAVGEDGQPRVASLLVLAGHEGRVTAAQFSADEQHLFTGSTDKTARLWDLRSGQCECVVRGHGGMVPSIALSRMPGGGGGRGGEAPRDWLLGATASGDGVCRMWDLSGGGQCWQEMKGWSEGAANLCAFTPTREGAMPQSKLVTAHIDFDRKEARALVWDTAPGGDLWVDGKLLGPSQQYDVFRSKIESLSFAFDSSGSLLMACCAADGDVKVFDITHNMCLYDLPRGAAHGEEGGKKMALFSPCGTYLAASEGGATLQIYSVEEGQQVATKRSPASIISMGWSADGTQLAVGSANGTFAVHPIL